MVGVIPGRGRRSAPSSGSRGLGFCPLPKVRPHRRAKCARRPADVRPWRRGFLCSREKLTPFALAEPCSLHHSLGRSGSPLDGRVCGPWVRAAFLRRSQFFLTGLLPRHLKSKIVFPKLKTLASSFLYLYYCFLPLDVQPPRYSAAPPHSWGGAAD